MMRRHSPRRAAWAAALLPALVLGWPAGARAQSEGLMFGTAATDAADKGALEKANSYFASLKGDKETPAQKQEQELARAGKPPTFPNPAVRPALSPAAVAAATALPQLGLGDQLLALALLKWPAPAAEESKEKPLPYRYSWARLRDRELRVLGLADPKQREGKFWNAAADARKEGKVYAHDTFHFLLSSREGAAGPEFFLLVREAQPEAAITEADLASVRSIPDETRPGVLIRFTEAGAGRLKDFTAANAPDREGKGPCYLIIVVRGEVIDISKLSAVIDTGQMQVRGRFKQSDVDNIVRSLQGLMRRPGGTQ
jgi:hypothetical protein